LGKEEKKFGLKIASVGSRGGYTTTIQNFVHTQKKRKW